MHRRLASIAAVVLVASACAASDQPAAGECPSGFIEGIDAWGDAGFNGTVAIIRGDESCITATGLRDRESAIGMTADSVFAIGSVSKSVTAAAIMRLVTDGELSLDATAGDIVDGLAGPAAEATVERLLVHTSGMLGDAGPDHQPLSEGEAVAAISELPLAFPAGTDFGYTNAGYTLLALVIEELTGDYRAYVADHVLGVDSRTSGAGFWDGEPAADGPRAVGYLDSDRTDAMGDFQGPHWATSGNGDLAMSTPVLAGWAAALFTGDVLSAETLDEITTPRWDHGAGSSETFGWVRFDASVFGAAGFASAGGGGDTGHNAIVAYIPEADTAIAVASSAPDITAEQLMQQIVAALVAGEPIPRPVTDVGTGPNQGTIDSNTIDRVSGTYTLDDGGQLVVSAENADGLTVRAIGDDAVDALFSLPRPFTTQDVDAHETAVVELLTGDDPVGAEERDILEDTVGRIEDVTARGTIVADNELRTYVTVTGSRSTLDLWYALTEQGAIAAAEGPTDPPSATFSQQRADTFVSVDPTGVRTEVTLTFGADTVMIDNGTTTATARKVS